MTSLYIPFLIQAALAAGIAGLIIAATHIFGQRSQKNAIKDTAYECGVRAEAMVPSRFSVKFYVTAMLFIIFDIEVVFLIPLTFVYREFLAHNIAIFWPIMFFVGVLVLGLFYEIKKGALDWEK